MAQTPDNQFDLIIIGGGLAGASLACALQDIHGTDALKIAVIEAYQLSSHAQPSYDDRTVALSYGSRCIFDSIGVWDSLAQDAEAINSIHISDRGHFGVTRLTREQEQVEALGYVLENRNIGMQLYTHMDKAENITLFCPAELQAIHQDDTQVNIEIRSAEKSSELRAPLLVAADGNRSQVMKLLNIGSNRQDYGQVALITNVTPGHKHQNVAYERFTETGPLAFLPMTQNRCSVVWTLKPQQADYLYAMPDADFLQHLQQSFGFRLGQIKKAGKRHIYPLFLQSATQTVMGRVAIIGNAAHSVHPVAGQGFNLALRDIALLAELITDNRREQRDIGDAALLERYAAMREQDVQRVYRFTDTLVKTFSNDLMPLAHMRSMALLMVDLLPELKHRLATQSMGLSGRLTRLNRGSGL